MEAFLVSTGIVALAEMGDKTQLLALILAVRFRKPVPIVLGIFVATTVNHGLAGALGAWLTQVIGPDILRWVLGASFIAMAVWMLIPDTIDDEEEGQEPRWGVFGTTVVAFFLAEMGDKTQLLALILAVRFRKPIPIVMGIFVATIVNHGLAGALGAWLTQVIGPEILRWVLGASFIAMAVWMLIPDTLDAEEEGEEPRWGVFGTTVIAFFLAEMGDKTQIATVMLAARFDAYYWVVAGTTLGMMLANVPVVYLGERMTRLVPMRVVHIVSALVFAVLGVLALLPI